MTPPPEKPPRLTRNELGRYIVADLIDRLGEAEVDMRTLKRAAENALAALNSDMRAALNTETKDE